MGINVAEIEFPAYFNFFIRQRQVNLITTHDVADRLRTVFQETLLGPKSYDKLSEEFLGDESLKRMPDFEKESAYFARNPFRPNESITVESILNVSFCM